jgi:predicted MFS family arabinose efflux permease
MTGPWAVLTITTALQALVSMAALTLPAMAPDVARALGVSPAYIGLYMAFLYVGAMLASLGAGNAVARFGAIRVSQGGQVLCAAGLALSTVPSVVALAAGGVLLGLGYGPITPASSHLLARTTPAARMSLVFSIKQTGVPLGGVLAGAIIPVLLLSIGWQGAMLVVAAANLVSAVIAQPLRNALDADRDATQRLALGNLMRPMHLVFSHPALRLLAGCSFIFSLTQMSLTSYVVTYMQEALAFNVVAAGLALSVAQVGGVGGRVLWGYVADRWLGARRMLAVLAGLMAVAAFSTAMLRPGLPLALVLGVLVLFGASATGWNGVYLGEVARRAPAGQAGLATGGTLAITFLGVVLGGPAFGGLSALFDSYSAGFIAVAIATAGCGVALLRAESLLPARKAE